MPGVNFLPLAHASTQKHATGVWWSQMSVLTNGGLEWQFKKKIVTSCKGGGLTLSVPLGILGEETL